MIPMSDIENPWFSGVQTALLILAVLVFLYRPRVVKSTLQAFFSQSGRRYEDNAGDRLPDIMGYVFYLATMTMAVACGFQQIRHGPINLSAGATLFVRRTGHCYPMRPGTGVSGSTIQEMASTIRHHPAKYSLCATIRHPSGTGSDSRPGGRNCLYTPLKRQQQ